MATQAEIDALRSAAAKGVLQVRLPNGSQVVYATPQQMLDAAAQLQAQLAGSDFDRTTLAGFDRTE
jgi:hypothetical protein